MALAPALWRISEQSLRETHGWRVWWWLDEWFLEPFVVALLALPGAAFWIHLGLAARGAANGDRSAGS